MRNQVVWFVGLVILGIFGNCNAGKKDGGGGGGLKMGYYKVSCKGVDVENMVRDLTWKNVSVNPRLPAQLLRLYFHDCFVRVMFKTQFQKPMWPVFTGRQDGRTSLLTEALDGLPSPLSDFPTLLQNFRSNNLDIVDLVALSGAHTIGVTHCFLMATRLYNFTGKGDTDPRLDVSFAQNLKTICPLPINPTKTLELDFGSSTSFDSSYYVNLKLNRTAFLSDAALLTDPESARIVTKLQKPRQFLDQFGRSMVKLGAVGVLTNGQGEIRKNCRVVN
ncbi:OLC1v1020288C2 [Oldenlandia corymbosa var. corymbosa]|uniref:peroxidase n=1 Tax=Oldenlandia corymbosa var. corymbosa TaxID=529605 RepID=A0AAV1EGD6_OLDCO|nr:OLC1v1020288C2 [Oldenlandia corymbosa var. corymbosa]